MLTYTLFKTQRMLLWATSRKCQPDADSHSVQNHSMLLSATSRNGQPDADLQTVQNPEHAIVSNKQENPARCWLTHCSNSKSCSCQQKAGKASQMLTYLLFKTQSIVLSATRRNGLPSADLHPVQKPEHSLFRKKQEGPVRGWPTNFSPPRSCSDQQQAGMAGQMMTYKLLKTQSMLLSETSRNTQPQTYNLFKTQSMLLSDTSRKGQPDPDLQSVQNPEHAFVRNKQEQPARCWLTICSKPRACSCQ